MREICFKPYYKWITFNTQILGVHCSGLQGIVLNLIINGLPSILKRENDAYNIFSSSFKPYYKWITFNTINMANAMDAFAAAVLNLIINGLPSIQRK